MPSLLHGDTIAALATARGQAALAIVRVSGPDALAVVGRLFPGKNLSTAPSHSAHVGYLVADGERVDQVVVTLFRAPRSATGEDVVEVTCHGGDVVPQRVLQALLDAGARLARPGEFTERAFLNGKLDLVQAEAVADLIHAQSSLAHRVSLNHLQGRYSDLLQQLRERLLHLAALVELELDFVEEDVEFADRDELEQVLREATALLEQLLGSYELGRLVRDGVRVVIGGRPNAGKSTLLNALVGRDRAIVSAIPGTTRDAIEAECEIGGLAFRFVDTAGLRETQDAIEAEGVRRTHRSIQHADVLLYVFDATHGLDAEEQGWLAAFATEHPHLPRLLIANKADLLTAPQAACSDSPALALSAKRALEAAAELQTLRDMLLDLVASDLTDPEATPVVVNQRHRQHLAQALAAVRQAQRAFGAGATGDQLALDLRQALHELGCITGAITNEDVLGTIFSRFCIGK